VRVAFETTARAAGRTIGDHRSRKGNETEHLAKELVQEKDLPAGDRLPGAA